MKTLTTASAIVLSLSISSALSMPVSAAPTTGPSHTVKYGDLDLSSKDGAAQAYARIRDAAHQVCKTFNNSDTESWVRMHECMRDSIAQAIAEVNNDNLNQIFTARTGTRVAVKGAVLAQR